MQGIIARTIYIISGINSLFVLFIEFKLSRYLIVAYK